MEPNRTLDEMSDVIRSEMTASKDATGQETERNSQVTGLDNETQVAPTENYLKREYRGWCFVQSEPMCCGYMPISLENTMRTIRMCETSGKSVSFDPETHTMTTAERSAGSSMAGT